MYSNYHSLVDYYYIIKVKGSNLCGLDSSTDRVLDWWSHGVGFKSCEMQIFFKFSKIL